MAHLRELESRCDICGKRATKRLYNRVNAALGKFCARCAKLALAAQKRLESNR